MGEVRWLTEQNFGWDAQSCGRLNLGRMLLQQSNTKALSQQLHPGGFTCFTLVACRALSCSILLFAYTDYVLEGALWFWAQGESACSL